MQFYYTKFPLFDLMITIQENFITKVDFLEKIPRCYIDVVNNDLINNIIAQLNCYLEDGSFIFKLPLKLCGSSYAQQVLQELLLIPAGTTQTYGDIALKLATSPRAVGGACRKNEIPLFIPCHRVVGKNNNLMGFMGSINGYNMQIKKWLLQHEGCVSK